MSIAMERYCNRPRSSVCLGHESEVICAHNFMSRDEAVAARRRLDQLTEMRGMGFQRARRPMMEAGDQFNQTQVLRIEPRTETGLRAQLWHGAQRANLAGGWRYGIDRLERNFEALQSVRYEAPSGWYAEHIDTRFTWRDTMRRQRNDTYSSRVIAVIVQLTDRDPRGDYTGGELQAVLQSGKVLDAPPCAGDAIFFPAAYLRHRVQHLRSGSRRNLVWWIKGSPHPDSGRRA